MENIPTTPNERGSPSTTISLLYELWIDAGIKIELETEEGTFAYTGSAAVTSTSGVVDTHHIDAIAILKEWFPDSGGVASGLKGLLQMNVAGVWKYVCDDGFDQNNYGDFVACRDARHANGIQFNGDAPVSDPYHPLQPTTTETHLLACPSTTGHSLGTYDAAISTLIASFTRRLVSVKGGKGGSVDWCKTPNYIITTCYTQLSDSRESSMVTDHEWLMMTAIFKRDFTVAARRSRYSLISPNAPHCCRRVVTSFDDLQNSVKDTAASQFALFWDNEVAALVLDTAGSHAEGTVRTARTSTTIGCNEVVQSGANYFNAYHSNYREVSSSASSSYPANMGSMEASCELRERLLSHKFKFAAKASTPRTGYRDMIQFADVTTGTDASSAGDSKMTLHAGDALQESNSDEDTSHPLLEIAGIMKSPVSAVCAGRPQSVLARFRVTQIPGTFCYATPSDPTPITNDANTSNATQSPTTTITIASTSVQGSHWPSDLKAVRIYTRTDILEAVTKAVDNPQPAANYDSTWIFPVSAALDNAPSAIAFVLALTAKPSATSSADPTVTRDIDPATNLLIHGEPHW